MAFFIGNFGKCSPSCKLKKRAINSIGSILLIFALMGSLIERSFSSDQQIGLEKGRIFSGTSDGPGVDGERFGPLWSSFYGGVVDYSPDGSRIAVGGSSVVFILNAKTYEIEKQLFGHTSLVSSIKWSPDGRYLASGGADYDATVKIWEAGTWNLMGTLVGLNRRVSSIAWSPDGERLAGATHPGGLLIWDVRTERQIKSLNGANAVTWSPDGRYVATGNFEAVWVYEVETENLVRIFERHNSFVQAVSWSPDGKYVASGAFAPFDLTVKVWEVETGSLTKTLRHDSDPVSLSWSPEGDYLACGGGFLKVWETETWDLVRTLDTGEILAITSVSWHPDGNHLVSGGGRIVNVWDLEAGTSIASLQGHRNEVMSVTWSPDGRYLASGSSSYPFFGQDTGVKIWDAETGDVIKTIPDFIGCGGLGSVHWSPDGKYLASGNGCRMLLIWEAETGNEVKRLERAGGAAGWNPDGRYLASVFGRTINIWELETETLVEAIEVESTQTVASVAWSPDGKYLASSGREPDSTVKIWEVGTWDLIATLQGLTTYGISSLTWSPDSRYLAGIEGVCCVFDIKIWELETGKLIRTIDSDNSVMSLMWSPDGKYLASGGATEYAIDLKLWDVETGNLIRALPGHNVITSVRWSPDGRYLASSSRDSTIRLWGERVEQ